MNRIIINTDSSGRATHRPEIIAEESS